MRVFLRMSVVAASLSLAASGAAAVDNPSFSPTGPDAEAYGAAEGYPVGKRGSHKQQTLVGTFSHFDQLYDSHPVARAPVASPLKRAEHGVSLTYRYEGRDRTIENYTATP